MNAAFALIQAVAPKNEIEGALAIQMACTRSAAMAALSRAASVGGRAFSGCFSSSQARWRAEKAPKIGLCAARAFPSELHRLALAARSANAASRIRR